SGAAPRGDAPARKDGALYASLRNPTADQGTNTYAKSEQAGLYVIVGRGPAAWYNHLTLLGSEWGRRRLGGLDAMHIGFREPWKQRGNERMGQWPRMLDLFKGFGDELALEPAAYERPEDWLPSRYFAAVLEKAEACVQQKYRDAPADSRGNKPDLQIKDGFV